MNENSFNRILITTHNYNIINKLQFKNVVLLKDSKAISFSEYPDMSKYLAKRPNFDILKILFSKRVILVEGPTEEMFINTYLQMNDKKINIAEVIVTGKGYKKFLDIWKKINHDTDKKIGVVRDYDNQPKAKEEHNEFDLIRNALMTEILDRDISFVVPKLTVHNSQMSEKDRKKFIPSEVLRILNEYNESNIER